MQLAGDARDGADTGFPAGTLVQGPDFDREQFEDLRALYDAKRLRAWFVALDELVAGLEAVLADSIAQPAHSAEALAMAAHALIGRAGLTGFIRFSEACRAFETVCRTGGNLDAARSAIRSELARMRRRRMLLAAEVGV